MSESTNATTIGLSGRIASTFLLKQGALSTGRLFTLAAFFAIATALAAQVRFFLPDNPVPITLQTAVVMFGGIALGPVVGTMGMALYVLLGMCGYHVFAVEQWDSWTVLGATGGYLIGFVLCQAPLGMIAGRGAFRWPALCASLVVSHVIIFGCGLIWLAWWLDAGFADTLRIGLTPFILGGVIKFAAVIVAARALAPGIRRRLVDTTD